MSYDQSKVYKLDYPAESIDYKTYIKIFKEVFWAKINEEEH